jgi:hypothetical protein
MLNCDKIFCNSQLKLVMELIRKYRLVTEKLLLLEV